MVRMFHFDLLFLGIACGRAQETCVPQVASEENTMLQLVGMRGINRAIDKPSNSAESLLQSDFIGRRRNNRRRILGNAANAVGNAVDNVVDSVQETTNGAVDTVQGIGPDTFVDDFVDHVQERANADVDALQDAETLDDLVDAAQESVNANVDYVQDIGPDTFVDDIVDHIQDHVNEDVDILQDIESVDDAVQVGVAVASMPARTVEGVGDFIIDTAQENVNEAIDNSQDIIGDTFVDGLINSGQRIGNDAVDTTQALDSIAGRAIDHVQEHANAAVDTSQNIVGDTPLDDVIDTVQEHANNIVDTIQHITGLTADYQYTPEQSDWSGFEHKVKGRHDPDGIDWIPRSAWEPWDGTVIDPANYRNRRAQFAELICPTQDTIRGLREVFYEHNPFVDNFNPTKAEVDEWHRIAVNHVRRMTGHTMMIQKDHCLFLRALWGNQRRRTTQWDADYPGTFDSAYGPCFGGSNGHCGATFLPSRSDQQPYLPWDFEENQCTLAGSSSEGVFSANANFPWSIKWIRGFCFSLAAEGLIGHTGPFFRREKFGWDFWDMDPDDPDSPHVTWRAKWGGNQAEMWYTNPS